MALYQCVNTLALWLKGPPWKCMPFGAELMSSQGATALLISPCLDVRFGVYSNNLSFEIDCCMVLLKNLSLYMRPQYWRSGSPNPARLINLLSSLLWDDCLLLASEGNEWTNGCSIISERNMGGKISYVAWLDRIIDCYGWHKPNSILRLDLWTQVHCSGCTLAFSNLQ